MKKIQPSMQAVADAAGVNRSTVSRALQSDPRISKETRDLVEAAAARLGYRPNALVSALMMHRRGQKEPSFRSVIAYVTRFAHVGAWKPVSESFERVFAGAAASAEKQGYKLEEFCMNEPRLSGESFTRMLRARGIHGVLIAPSPRPSSHLRLGWEHFAAVTVGFSVTRPELHRVATDHFGSLIAALRKCRKYGYRRPGVMLTGWVNERTDRRWLGAHLVENANSTEPVPALVAKDFDDAVFARWFRKNKPDVLLGVHMYRVTAALKKMRIRVPEDVGVVSLELREREAGYSGLDQSFEQIGAAAVNTIIAQLHRGEYGLPVIPQKILLDALWKDGATLPKRKLSA